ncbi:MAG: hypothetical protein HN726_04065 [Candidatus Magasanikbacteria bacterium]|jgi:photosystem II stability/assembly factor-like uncharacterized protein|nr:hypothetical protein [Candidatus Magasanikbacteria bacterium]MBT4221153.1 hypothetical protein [Candidatus Magasanikbacteria bacterium]MBT4350277.1 hypothetical protein [Candidatus Magasanikbacteria bacterium]MBT4541703.1 hypothetical protein [Candidatus Magasanikbacteria bacterium]MBT6253320.1 hypothetical protein [Candidatus Magasanikbacteria bacterium]
MTSSTYIKTSVLIGAALIFLGAGCVSFNEGGTSGSAGMFVSTSQGEEWKKIATEPTVDGNKDLSNSSVYRLEGDPQDPDTMYWATRGQGLFFTYDNGKTWRGVGAPLNTGFIYAMAVHPKDKCTMYASVGSTVFKSSDCARSWKNVYRESRSTVRVQSIAFSPFPPYQIMLVDSDGGVHQSIDEGVSWDTLVRFKKTNLHNVIFDPFVEKTVYIASKKKGLFRSRDGGVTWDALLDNIKSFPQAKQYRRMVYHPYKQNVLYWVSEYGILVTEDGGDRWEELSINPPAGSAKIYGFAINPKNDQEIYFTATIGTRSTFYATTNGAKSWETEKLPSGQVPTALRIHPEDGFVYLGMTVPPENK